MIDISYSAILRKYPSEINYFSFGIAYAYLPALFKAPQNIDKLIQQFSSTAQFPKFSFLGDEFLNLDE